MIDVIIEFVESNPVLVFGFAGLIGGAVRGVIAYRQAKKEDDVDFDKSIFSDTIIKGVAAGAAISLGLPYNPISLIVTALAAAGVDTYTNKFGLSMIPALRDYAISKGETTKAKSKKK